MKITDISVYQLDIPLAVPSPYPNKTYTAFDDTIVRIDTDSGHIGWGEVCPIGSLYQPEHALGVRAAIAEMANGLLGQDPTQTGAINARMDDWMMGGLNAKSAIDIACWDLAGKAVDRPVYKLLGGRLQESALCYTAVEVAAQEPIAESFAEYRKRGYSYFQIKNKTQDLDLAIYRIREAAKHIRPGERLVVDANKAWKTHEALRVLRATEDLDFYIEQPCLTYEECAAIRPHVRQPMILDECMTDIGMVLRGLKDDSFEGVGAKITRMGGITGMRLVRDVLGAAGKFLSIDDMWGADLSAAAQAHLAVSTPQRVLSACYISTDFSHMRYDKNAATVVNGRIAPLEKPGLGVEPDLAVLGAPVAVYS